MRGGLSRGRKVKIEKRRQKVAELFGKKSYDEIAQIIGTSRSTVIKDVEVLRERGIIEGKPHQVITMPEELTESISQRRKQVSEYWGKLTIKEIANELGISVGTVNNDIRYLKEHGMLRKDILNKRMGDKKRRKQEERLQQVAELFGVSTYEEIASLLGVSPKRIYSDVEILRKRGVIGTKLTRVMTIERKRKINERRRKVYILSQKKVPRVKIANQLGYSLNTIKRDITFLNKLGISSLDDFDEYVQKQEVHESTQSSTQSSQKEGTNTQIKYISEMISQVKDYLKAGNIDLAIEYMEELNAKVDFSEENRRKYQAIMRKLQSIQGNGENQVNQGDTHNKEDKRKDGIEIGER